MLAFDPGELRCHLPHLFAQRADQLGGLGGIAVFHD
jgi:hypothetical protein